MFEFAKLRLSMERHLDLLYEVDTSLPSFLFIVLILLEEYLTYLNAWFELHLYQLALLFFFILLCKKGSKKTKKKPWSSICRISQTLNLDYNVILRKHALNM
jgi:hypothetical protein